MQWYLKVLRQYFEFDGRARRKEFWMFTLVSVLIALGLLLVPALGAVLKFDALVYTGLVLFVIYGGVMFIPTLAVTSRRLHDTGRSGWWQLLNLIPFVNYVGWIPLLVFEVQDGVPGPNQYGPDPKAAERGFVEPGYPGAPGYPQGYPPAPGHPQPGYPAPGHPQPGYPAPGHPQAGYPQAGGTQPPYGT